MLDPSHATGIEDRLPLLLFYLKQFNVSLVDNVTVPKFVKIYSADQCIHHGEKECMVHWHMQLL